MIYETLNKYKEETHPWQPYIPIGAEQLILGTFPTSERNRGSYDFFYPNPKNNFWRVLFEVVGKNLNDYSLAEPVQLRKQILSELKLGIADIGKRILRQKDSSKDDSLFPIEYTNIFLILEANPTIKKIIITSSSGANSVLSWFHHYCILNSLSFKIPKGSLPQKTYLLFNNNEIKIDIVSSTSMLSPFKGDRLFQMYRDVLLNDLKMQTANYKIDKPQNFSNEEKETFLELLIKQNKVRNPTIDRINGCTLICVCKIGNEIVSIGAIKPKTNSDFDFNKADLDQFRNDFALEVGYCFTLPNHTGNGFSSTILNLLIEKHPNTNLMASTELRPDNSMIRILERNNFKRTGKIWKSRIHNGPLGLFLKFAVSDIK